MRRSTHEFFEEIREIQRSHGLDPRHFLPLQPGEEQFLNKEAE